jgi:hypothetical protein
MCAYLGTDGIVVAQAETALNYTEYRLPATGYRLPITDYPNLYFGTHDRPNVHILDSRPYIPHHSACSCIMADYTHLAIPATEWKTFEEANPPPTSPAETTLEHRRKLFNDIREQLFKSVLGPVGEESATSCLMVARYSNLDIDTTRKRNV